MLTNTLHYTYCPTIVLVYLLRRNNFTMLLTPVIKGDVFIDAYKKQLQQLTSKCNLDDSSTICECHAMIKKLIRETKQIFWKNC